MKNPVKKVIHGFLISALLIGAAQAVTTENKQASENTLQPLPLTSAQITKLQHLFPSTHPVETSLLAVSTPPAEHIVWQQTPIDVVLPVGQERLVSFPGTVQFGYDKNQLSDSVLRVQNNGGTLYLLAKAAFTPQRVEVKLVDSGKNILFNLSAQKEASNVPLAIVLPETVTADSAVTATMDNTDITANKTEGTINYLTLTRFAAQQLYAPKRLLIQPPNIYRTPMHTAKTVALLRDGSAIAMPLASWRADDLFVTAVLLRNQTKQPLSLDPRILCGTWQAATFFPKTILTPAGTKTDTTTVFLISRQPFNEALTN